MGLVPAKVIQLYPIGTFEPLALRSGQNNPGRKVS